MIPYLSAVRATVAILFLGGAAFPALSQTFADPNGIAEPGPPFGGTASPGDADVLVYMGNGGTSGGGTWYPLAEALALAERTVVVETSLPSDLSHFCTVYLPINSVPFSASQQAQFNDYLLAGGTLVALGDHAPTWNAGTANMNALAAYVGSSMSITPGQADCNCHATSNILAHTLTDGVASVNFGCVSTLNVGQGALLVRSSPSSIPIAGVEEIGEGRFVFCSTADLFVECELSTGNQRLIRNLCASCCAADDISRPLPAGPAAPHADDRTFVSSPSFICSGELTFDINVTRFAGETNAAGQLVNREAMIEHGMVVWHAILEIAAFDVDSDANEPNRPPEIDNVLFNGVPVEQLDPGNSSHLEGEDGEWCTTSFRIPIQHVQFPAARGSEGNPPIPRSNQIQINVDVGNGGWCTSIGWAALKIQIISPVIFLPGLGLEPESFHDVDFDVALTSAGLGVEEEALFDGISLGFPKVVSQAAVIGDELVPLARMFGADSVHLVAHSLGGLSAREYLAQHYKFDRASVQVLSLTTLSTPHEGTVLADVASHKHRLATLKGHIHFRDFPSYTNGLASLLERQGFTWQYEDLTTWAAVDFNARHDALLPKDVVYSAIGADADQNGNGRIDLSPDEFGGMAEAFPGMRPLFDVPGLLPLLRSRLNALYQINRNIRATGYIAQFEGIGPETERIRDVYPIPSLAPRPNDIAVTQLSAFGLNAFDGTPGMFARRVTLSGGRTHFYQGSEARDHGRVLNEGVGTRVLDWLRSIERQRGDLR